MRSKEYASTRIRIRVPKETGDLAELTSKPSSHPTSFLNLSQVTFFTFTPYEPIVLRAKALPCSSAKALVFSAKVRAGASTGKGKLGRLGPGRELALQALVDYKQLFGSCMLMLPRGPISNNFNSMSKNGTSFFTCHVRFMNCNTFHIVYCMSYVTSSPVPAMLASGFLTPEPPCACCWSRHRHKANTRKRDSLCHNELNHEPTSMAEKHFFSVRNPSQSLWRLENPVAANTTKLTYMT